jgi:signal transduction histidine kinase
VAALAGVYLGVSANLAARVRDKKLDTLTALAHRYSQPIHQALDRSLPRSELDARVRTAADSAGARVTLLGVAQGSRGLHTYLSSDSAAVSQIRDLRFDVALRAARTGGVARATETGAIGRVAEAALPLRLTPPSSDRAGVYYVAVYSAPLEDVNATADLLRGRVLLDGAIALLLATLVGYLAARAFSRRIRRMEKAARRVAAGDFSARFERGARDELGQLAATLDRMQRQLGELDVARRRFIATASHELRTPIFSLGGFVELLEHEELDEETRRIFLRQLRQQVDRLGKLTTDLLDLSRLEAGSVELRPEATDVGALAETVAAEFAPAAGAHDSELELRVGTDPVEARCDPDRVAQIMRILIDNALSHTPPGTDVLVAAARENGRVRLSVTDHGTGIEQEALPRIFEPFYTADDAPGAGLGLAIAHELAERMEGELSAESVPGRTTFSLELPP